MTEFVKNAQKKMYKPEPVQKKDSGLIDDILVAIVCIVIIMFFSHC